MRYQKHIFKSVTLNASAQRVWQLLRPENGALYIPEITVCEWSSERNKWTRIGSTQNGRKLKERIESIDINSKQYSYHMVEQDLWPVSDYKGEIRVVESGNQQATVEWSLAYLVDPEHDLAAQMLLRTSMEDTLMILHKRLNVSSKDSLVFQIKAA